MTHTAIKVSEFAVILFIWNFKNKMTTIKNSKDCIKSELDLFFTLPTNTSILRSNITLYPTSVPLDGKEDTFSIEIPANEEFADLNDIFLQVEVNIDGIQTGSGTPIVYKKVAPINNFAHSLFRNVELSLGNGLKKTLIETGNYYAYKSYMLNLLNFDSSSKQSWMQLGLWNKDENSEWDTEEGKGFVARRKCFIDGKDNATFIIPLRLDFLNTNRLLVNRYGMTFVFKKNDNRFLLIGKDSKDFKVLIKKASILSRRCIINPSILLGLQNGLSASTLKYPIKQNKLYSCHIENGISEFTTPAFSTIIPNKVVIAIIEDETFYGNDKNPFNFKHHNVSKCSLIIDSQEHVIRLKTDQDDFSEGYHSMFQALDFYNQGSNSINLEDYKNGYTLYVFNLNPDKGCHEQFNPLRTGNVVIKFDFKSTTNPRLRVLCLMEYDNQLNIDKNGEIYYDYIVS